ncbi:MAG: 2OG-Fe(II) oxygenase [Maioricimonas sp. JB045]|uniref:2OG-Fe(II) oxygenase n=1 Tax=Maioricimonas sp. JC845 TaxID=3232138 RepID=UPI003459F990
MSLLNIEALRSTPLKTEPFEYCVVPDFVTGEALERIQADFPDIEHGGSFPLDALTYGPAFDEMAQELLSPEVRDIFGEYFGIDLEGRPPTLTVRGRTRLKDGKIHLDSKTKLITVLIYFNPDWDSEGGRLRFLGSGNNIEDVIDEVVPGNGTLVAFRCRDNAWHGHKPYDGVRRSIQLNWVVDEAAARRSHKRHRFSSLLKSLRLA